MSESAYSFLPWLRAGIATKIGETPPSGPRATIPVKLVLAGDPVDGVAKLDSRTVEHDVQLYGPGDVVGVDPRAISRTEPRAWITAFEPNYLAHIEFYDEDFPWRYSPAPQDATHRVVPWLALIVLAAGKDPKRGTAPAEGDEFAEGDQAGTPLPYITIAAPRSTLQPPTELGAWAHVHVNGALADSVAVDLDSDGQGPALDNLRAVLAANADNACSRVICPRHLQPDTSYHAFLVPAFESGRLAGLGVDIPGDLNALQPSWGPGTESAPRAGQMPYYFRWFFSTGDAGDFDHLVRLLQPNPADPNVARRDIDVHYSPGFTLPGIDDPVGGILKLGGALQPDRTPDKYDLWDRPKGSPPGHPFQTALANLINLADDYLTRTPAAAHAAALGTTTPPAPAPVDPIITPPLYGRWPALSSRLLTNRDGTTLIPDYTNESWVQRLNLDPRYRVAANFGTEIFQARQEEFMTAAWEQVGDVVKANTKIRAAQLQREVGRNLHAKHLDQPASPAGATTSGRALTVTAPVHPRVTQQSQTTVGYQVAASQVRAAPVSSAMRRLIRPGSRLVKGLKVALDQQHLLLDRMDRDPAAGGVVAAARKIRPDSVVTSAWVDNQVRALANGTPPPAQPAPPPPGTGAPLLPTLPINTTFALTTDLDAIPSPTPATSGTGDSGDAANLKSALNDLYNGWQVSFAAGPTIAPSALGLNTVTQNTLHGLHSDTTVPKNVNGAVTVPTRLAEQTDTVAQVMAYPRIDLPMYEALRDASVEEFVPNLGLVPPNTITLLLTDHAFIESFMVGLNHAMARELLWREYPTDQRGTPFRQFWDPHATISLPGESTDARRERLYDIKPIDRWRNPDGTFTQLGLNGNRPLDPSKDPNDPKQQENLVLVIRGELLKKYPTAVIYANKAAWELGQDGKPDFSQKRLVVPPADPNQPTRNEIRMPIFGAKIEPDLYLFGFDLTEDEARGYLNDKNATPVDDGSGWFFVLKERPGDPRFGAELDQLTDLQLWDDISWPDIDPGPQHGFIEVGSGTKGVFLDTRTADDANLDQRRDDLGMPPWSGTLSSADIAYILFRVPVLMAVHAQEMLPHVQPPQ